MSVLRGLIEALRSLFRKKQVRQELDEYSTEVVSGYVFKVSPFDWS